MNLVSAAFLGSLKSLVVLFIISSSSSSTVGLDNKALLVNGGYVDLLMEVMSTFRKKITLRFRVSRLH